MAEDSSQPAQLLTRHLYCAGFHKETMI